MCSLRKSAVGAQRLPGRHLFAVMIGSFERRYASMAKTHRKIKKANHGRRPASAKARRAKRRHIRT
ncbi:MAG: hypothetical protein D6725_02210 [Planctomycetota bacterium]|nr:MAG: hypothetical protein D6725_02210 [Planctomycetota bacterium]